MALPQEKNPQAYNIYAVIGTIDFNITDDELFENVINAVINRYKYIYIKKYQKYVPLTKELILQQNREAPFVYFRQLICYCLRKKRVKLQQIGRLMGQDHTTIIHAVTSFKNRIETLAAIPETIEIDSANTQEDYSYFKKLV